MSIIRKYHNHKLLTNPWHHKKEPPNNHKTPGRQTEQNNQLSLPYQDDCNTRMDTKYHTAKHRKITESHNGSHNKERINNKRTDSIKLKKYGIKMESYDKQTNPGGLRWKTRVDNTLGIVRNYTSY